MKKRFIVLFLLVCLVFTCVIFVIPTSAFSYSESDASVSLVPYVDYSITYYGKTYFGDNESIRFPKMSLGPISVFSNENNTIRYSSFDNSIGDFPVSLQAFRQIVEVVEMEGVLFRDVNASEYGMTFYDVSSYDDFTQLHTIAGEDIYITGFDFTMNDFVIDLPSVMKSSNNFDMFFLPSFIYNLGAGSSYNSSLSFDLIVYEEESEYSPSQVQRQDLVPVYYHCDVVADDVHNNNIIAFNDVNVYAENEYGYIIDLYEKYKNSNTYAQITNFSYHFQLSADNSGSIGYFNDITYNVNYCDNATYDSLIKPSLEDLNGDMQINSIPFAPEGQLRYTPNITLALFNEIPELNSSWYWEANNWFGRYQQAIGGDSGIGVIASSFVGSIADTVSQFFDIDIFGVGLTFGHILGVILTILIVVVFLRLFAGG